jgi:hypothetical protein
LINWRKTSTWGKVGKKERIILQKSFLTNKRNLKGWIWFFRRWRHNAKMCKNHRRII